MVIRLGYACISETLNVTTSSTYTYTNYVKEKDLDKLNSIIISNLEALEEVLKYNIANSIHFYRLSSSIIPLATKEDVEFNYLDNYDKWYKKLSFLINKYKLRIDFHPDQFCVLNSTKKEVVDNTFQILEYHYNLLEQMNIKDKVLVIHVGSNVFGKKKSLERFISNFNKLPKKIQKSIAVENDDKVFTIIDCLYLHEKLGIPVVLDYHHFICNHEEERLEDYIVDIFKSWNGKTPKVHFSSPKNRTKKEIRSHHDYIDLECFINFVEMIKNYNYDIDIMIEAKKKDDAMFRLIRGLKYKTKYQFLDDTSFLV